MVWLVCAVDQAVVVVVVPGVAEAVDSVKADGDKAAIAAVTAVATAKEDTAVATMDMDTIITEAVGTVVTVATVTTVDTVILLIIIRIAMTDSTSVRLLSRIFFFAFWFIFFSFEKKIMINDRYDYPLLPSQCIR